MCVRQRKWRQKSLRCRPYPLCRGGPTGGHHHHCDQKHHNQPTHHCHHHHHWWFTSVTNSRSDVSLQRKKTDQQFHHHHHPHDQGLQWRLFIVGKPPNIAAQFSQFAASAPGTSYSLPREPYRYKTFQVKENSASSSPSIHLKPLILVTAVVVSMVLPVVVLIAIVHWLSMGQSTFLVGHCLSTRKQMTLLQQSRICPDWYKWHTRDDAIDKNDTDCRKYHKGYWIWIFLFLHRHNVKKM